MSIEAMIPLGARVRDRISGWTGTAAVRYEYLNGCIRYEVAAADKDGKPEGFVFDWQQLEVIPDVAAAEAERLAQTSVARVGTGGDRSTRPVPRP